MRKRIIFLGLVLVTMLILHASASLGVLAVPNGSFEDGKLCTVPDNWVMETYDYTEAPPPISTYIHEVCENDTHYFSGVRSCWLHSKVIDTDGTKRARYSHTYLESEDWINEPNATYVRFYVTDIQPTHSPLGWGWNDEIWIGFNDSVVDGIVHFIFNNGEYLNFNHYNDTKVGADGSQWYEYLYPIPANIDKTHFKIQIDCIAGDWTFYDTFYFAEMSFYVDNVELLYAVSPPLSVSISPLSASISVGNSMTFTSTVSGGTAPYSYQWYLDGNPVLGATSNSWTFAPTANGIFFAYLKVTDAFGNTIQSEAARITVASPPVGGYSFSIEGHMPAKPLIPYLALLAVVVASFVVIRRKTTLDVK